MNINLNSVIAVLAVIYILAQAVERLIEIAKPLLEKFIKDVGWLKSAKIGLAVLVGFGVSALVRYDLLGELGIAASPVLGYLATALIASVGSSAIHALLEWLRTLSVPEDRM